VEIPDCPSIKDFSCNPNQVCYHKVICNGRSKQSVYTGTTKQPGCHQVDKSFALAGESRCYFISLINLNISEREIDNANMKKLG